jgi:hypothetical protein
MTQKGEVETAEGRRGGGRVVWQKVNGWPNRQYDKAHALYRQSTQVESLCTLLQSFVNITAVKSVVMIGLKCCISLDVPARSAVGFASCSPLLTKVLFTL